MVRRVAACLAITALNAACGGSAPAPSGSVAGLVVVTTGGTALVDGARDVPPTLDLRVSGSAIGDSQVGASLDGRPLPLAGGPGAITATVSPPLPLGSDHRLELDVAGRDHRSIPFHVVDPAAAFAAAHADPQDGFVLDLTAAQSPDRGRVEAAIPGGQRTWVDDRHLRVAWPAPPGGSLHLDSSIPTARGSHLAAELSLDLGAVAPGAMRTAVVPAAGAAPSRPVVIGFSADTEASRRSVEEHADQVSILSPTGLVAQPDGTVGGAPDPPAVASAQAHGVPLWPLVQNLHFDGDAVHRLLQDGGAVGRQVEALRALAASGADGGIQLDFERVGLADRDALSAYVHALARALHGDGRRLAVDIVPHKPGRLTSFSEGYDLGALAREADLVVVMAYDEHTEATGPGPVAGLGWQGQVLDGSLPELDSSRALLGMPLYSRTWEPTRVTSDPYGAAVADPLRRPGARVDYDVDAATPFIRWGDGRTLTYVDDADSLARKLGLAGDRRLPGVAVWRLGFEDPRFWSLVPSPAVRPNR